MTQRRCILRKCRKYFLAIFLPVVVLASDGEGENSLAEDRLELDPVVVVASKTPRLLSQVAAQVTIIDIDDIQEGMVEDFNGLLKYEPGLELETAGTRFGARGLNIRGIKSTGFRPGTSSPSESIPMADGYW